MFKFGFKENDFKAKSSRLGSVARSVNQLIIARISSLLSQQLPEAELTTQQLSEEGLQIQSLL